MSSIFLSVSKCAEINHEIPQDYGAEQNSNLKHFFREFEGATQSTNMSITQ